MPERIILVLERPGILCFVFGPTSPPPPSFLFRSHNMRQFMRIYINSLLELLELLETYIYGYGEEVKPACIVTPLWMCFGWGTEACLMLFGHYSTMISATRGIYGEWVRKRAEKAVYKRNKHPVSACVHKFQ